MSNPDPVKAVYAIVATTIIVVVFAFAYFQMSSAIRDVTDEDSPTQDILDTSDKTASIIFPWLIPGAIPILALILYYLKKSV